MHALDIQADVKTAMW